MPGCDNDKTPAGKFDNHISTPKVNDLGPTIAADTIGDANANDIDGNEELEVSSATHATSAIAAEPSNDANEEDGNDASVYGATNNEDGSKCNQGNDEARKNPAAQESVEDTITGHEGLTRNSYLSKVGTPGTLEYREIFLIYREIFEKSYFFKKFWS